VQRVNETALRIASARGVPGTAGALVADGAGRRLLLANYHVVFGGGAETGDPVWAIPPGRDPDCSHDAVCIGVAERGHLGRVTFAGDTCFVDCAVVALADETGFPSWLEIQLAGAVLPESAEPEVGMPVFKTGGTTGRTEGCLVDVTYRDHPFVGGRWRSAPAQLLVEPRDVELNFAAPGDSGAPLVDERGRIVGILWGSNANGQGIATPIAPVLDCLGVSLAAR
jgi:hypothetical protein